MDSNAHEESTFSWGSVGVDLDDVEMSETTLTPNDPAFPVDEYLDLESTHLSFTALLLNPLSEALVEEGKLPYSWMAQDPGKAAKCLDNKSCAKHIVARPGNMSPTDVQGETLIERLFKRDIMRDPHGYFFRVVAFSCIMDLNSDGLLYPSILAAIIGRLFNGDSGLLAVFNQFFMPPDLRIEYTTRRAVIHNIYLRIKHHIGANGLYSSNPHFPVMVKVLQYMALDGMCHSFHLDQTVGKLVSASSGREFHPNPGAYTILRRPALSERFNKRLGKWWPRTDLTWQEVDVLGLHKPVEAKKEDTLESVNPRHLTVRNKDRAEA